MYLTMKNILLHNVVLKVISGIIGITFWLMASQSYKATLQCTVPVCFYASPADRIIKAPETVSVTLCGKRNDLKALERSSLAIHINAQKLAIGPNRIVVSHATLFLPKSINVLNYTPLNSVITVENAQQEKSKALSHSHKPLTIIPA